MESSQPHEERKEEEKVFQMSGSRARNLSGEMGGAAACGWVPTPADEFALRAVICQRQRKRKYFARGVPVSREFLRGFNIQHR